ncbi:cupin domain-containing protein [Streptomyces sp. NPDC007088]|uniref:cupin domain-containing protein n=1 Tax=Streptomyces sp. NPDC007088 TaxID=3364773 RepID=UPI003692FF86
MNRRTLLRSSGLAAALLGGGAQSPAFAGATELRPVRTGTERPPVTAEDPTGPVDPGDPTAGVIRTELQRHPSPAKGWLTVQTLVQIPRHKQSGRHSHPGVEIGYIVRGEVLMEFDEGPSLRLHTGDPFFIPTAAIHNALNVGRETTMMLSSYVIDENEPLVTTY